MPLEGILGQFTQIFLVIFLTELAAFATIKKNEDGLKLRINKWLGETSLNPYVKFITASTITLFVVATTIYLANYTFNEQMNSWIETLSLLEKMALNLFLVPSIISIATYYTFGKNADRDLIWLVLTAIISGLAFVQMKVGII